MNLPDKPCALCKTNLVFGEQYGDWDHPLCWSCFHRVLPAKSQLELDLSRNPHEIVLTLQFELEPSE